MFLLLEQLSGPELPQLWITLMATALAKTKLGKANDSALSCLRDFEEYYCEYGEYMLVIYLFGDTGSFEQLST